MASAAACTLPLPPPLRRTCATPTCDEHCAHCRRNDRIAAGLEDGEFMAVLFLAIAGAPPLTMVLPNGGAAVDDYAWAAAMEAAACLPVSPPCYLHEVALQPTSTECVAVYNSNHMDSCRKCKYNHVKRLNSPDAKWYVRDREVFVISWG